jgi:hypothetical protein
MGSRLLFLFVACSSWTLHSSSPCQLPASEPDRAPVANAIGRFFGIGYSAGYHARYESRLGWMRYVPDHADLPSSSYAIGGLPADTMGTHLPASLQGATDTRASTTPDALPAVTGALPAVADSNTEAPRPWPWNSRPPADRVRQFFKPQVGPAPGAATRQLDAPSPSDQRSGPR